jgi:hypothetical protein
LQLSYSLTRLGVDHAVLSDDPAPGGMFRRWPVFQRMLSWTKPFTGIERTSRAYERYDWNSLLADDEAHRAVMPALMDGTSYFPSRPEMQKFMLAWSTHTLGLVAVATGNVDLGKRWFSEALRLFVEAKDLSGIILQLDNLSVIARSEGDPVRATRLAAAAVALQTSIGTGLGGLLSQREGRTGREGLTETAAATAWAEGQRLTLDEAIAYALDPTALPVSLRDD